MNVRDVDIFIPCCVDQLYPQTGFNMIKLLKKLNIEVHYNPEQTCCGQSMFKNGYWDEAKEIGEKFIKEFDTGRYIVVPSASCVSYIKKYYKNLFYNTSLHLEYKRISEHIFELTDYLVNILRLSDVGAEFAHKVTYHDSCSALREYGLREEPRVLLSNVKGLELIEMQHTDDCCGYGGMFNLHYENVSLAMTEQKVNNALATAASYIVSTDASCLGNMDAYIKKQKLPIQCIHIADILAANL